MAKKSSWFEDVNDLKKLSEKIQALTLTNLF